MKNDDGPAIRTRGLSKSFGPVKAVVNVDLDVRRGEIYAFLGRNGAGKTTTIRMLLGLVRPSAGEISILGASLERDRRRALARIGFFVESASAYPNLTVRENLHIQRLLTSAPLACVDEVIDLLKLGEYANRRAGRLSLGNKQRLSLARALLSRSEILILDEPVNGLDPAGIIEIRTLLRRLADDQGRTVFMSSHLLAEVEHLADRVGIVHAGRLVEEVDLQALRDKGRLAIEIEVDDAARAERVLRDDLGLSGLSPAGNGLLRITDRSVRPAAIARALIGAGIALERLVPIEESLEGHFMRVTGEAS
ncbi:MAG: ABC transporter ATP-binding protein [Acidobacteriota bacterium]|nr:ABC transporter ATP-binding protein [Acidobacteriota bacterium]